MAESKNIVKHPGGVILHLQDGSAEYFGYGTEVDEDRLADYQKDTLGNYTDDKDRSGYRRDQETAAHKNAAFADSGQINSTSDPVPGNYGELSEEDAAQLLLAMQGDPQIQARLLLHERVACGSRQMVIDAGSPLATAIAETLFKHMEDNSTGGGTARFDQTPVVDRERQVEREAKAHEAKAAKSGGASKSSASKSSGGQTPSPSGG